MKLLSSLVHFVFTWSFLMASVNGGGKNDRDLEARIVGGTVVTTDKYPQFAVVQARIQRTGNGEVVEDQITCGGALIAPDLVLTIGHCVDDPDIVQMRAFLQLTNVNNDNEFQLIEAESWGNNPNFPQDRTPGIVRLVRDVQGITPLNVNLDPSLPAQGVGEIVTMGFGYTVTDPNAENARLSVQLREVTLDVNYTFLCNMDFQVEGEPPLNNRYQFCAGGNGKGPCVGDSGSPAIDPASGLLVGIVSFGGQLCAINPTVFSRISGFRGWVRAEACGREGKTNPEWCRFRPPTSAPTLAPGETDVCFAGSSTVEVENRGATAMRDLSIGDRVLVGKGVFEPIYSFGHFAPSQSSEFVELTTSTSSLRLSRDHMVFEASGKAIPASLIQIGDRLLDYNSNQIVVKSIKFVQDQGMFAPFTPSGKIVVNRILASNYIAFHDTRSLSFGTINASHHWVAHAGTFPLRFVCYYVGSCENEKYTIGGISEWVYRPLSAGRFFIRLDGWTASILNAFVITLLMTFSFFEALMFTNPLVLSSIACLVFSYGFYSVRAKRI